MKAIGKLFKIVGAAVVLMIVFFLFVMCTGNSEKKGDSLGQVENEQSESTSDGAETETAQKQEVTVDPIVINKKKIKISVTGYDNSANALKFNFENETNKDVTISASAYSVNGIMVSDNMFDLSCDISKKRKANENLTVDTDFLNDRGITQIRYFDIIFHAWDSDEYGDILNTDVLRIVTNLYEDKVDKINGTKLIKDKGIQVDYIGNEDDVYVFAIKNTNNEYIRVNADNITVNDYTSSDWEMDAIDRYIFGKQTALMKLTVDDDFKEKNSITDVKKIEFKIKYNVKRGYKTKKTKLIKLKL